MSSKALISEQLHLSLSHKTTIADILCLLNNRIFIYFNSGRYQHWNLKCENEGAILLHEGKIDVNLYNLQALSDTRIFYINLNKKCFEVFDLVTYTIISHFGSPLPTTIAFSSSDRSSLGEDIMKFDTDVTIFRDTQTIVIFEQNKKGQDEKFGVTVLDEEACGNQSFIHQFLLFGMLKGNNKFYFSKTNEMDTVVIYNQSNENNLPKIWLLNASTKLVRFISLETALPGIIIDVKGWEPNKLSIWMNYDNSNKVKMVIIDYEKAKVTKEGQGLVELVCDSHELLTLDEGTDKSHQLMDVIDVDYTKGIVLLCMMISQNSRNRLFLYDTKTMKECFRKLDFSDEEGSYINSSLSIDKIYFVEFPKDEGGEEKETEEISSFDIVYSQILPLNILTADLMEKPVVFEKFGQSSGKKIFDATNE